MGFVRPALPLLLLASIACKPEYIFEPNTVTEFLGVEPSIDHGSWLSMDVAPDGQRLVMAYYDRELDGLGFATGTPKRDGTIDWVHEQVDGYSGDDGFDVGDRGKYASMKVAPDGTVWIAYYDAKKGNLHYAHRTGGAASWITGIVDQGEGLSNQDAGSWASLDLDANGNPVIAYHDEGEGVLKIARPTDLSNGTVDLQWTVETAYTGTDYTEVVDADNTIYREADVGEYARLYISGATEYVAFYDRAQQRLGLVEGSAGAYSMSYVTPEGVNMGQWPSILVDAGTLHIAFHDVTNQDLVVATRGSGGYQLAVADGGEFVGADTEIHKRSGNLAVLYFDGHDNDMKLAVQNGGAWVIDTIGASDKAVGFHNEVVRVSGAWYLGSYDFTNRRIFLEKQEDGQ